MIFQSILCIIFKICATIIIEYEMEVLFMSKKNKENKNNRNSENNQNCGSEKQNRNEKN